MITLICGGTLGWKIFGVLFSTIKLLINGGTGHPPYNPDRSTSSSDIFYILGFLLRGLRKTMISCIWNGKRNDEFFI